MDRREREGHGIGFSDTRRLLNHVGWLLLVTGLNSNIFTTSSYCILLVETEKVSYYSANIWPVECETFVVMRTWKIEVIGGRKIIKPKLRWSDVI